MSEEEKTEASEVIEKGNEMLSSMKRDPNFVPTGAMTSTGDLTVEAGEKKNGVSLDAPKEEEKVKKPQLSPLPEMGTVFKIGEFDYKVTYINAGQKRFSAEGVIN